MVTLTGFTGSINWIYWFYKWYLRHSKNDEVAPEITSEPSNIVTSPLPESTIPFVDDNYKELLKISKGFIPSTLNPSHLYDLIFCPRRYQYAVLQQVKGGPHCQQGTPTDYDSTRFGKNLHKALELWDFTKTVANPEYSDFIGRIEVNDVAEAKRIKKAVKSFIRSEFFEDYALMNKKVRKELQVLHLLHEPKLSADILMKDKIDLIVEDEENSVIIVDYKTNYPLEEGPAEDFARNHYKYQILAYASAIKDGFGIDVSEALVLSYDASADKWSKHEIDISKSELKEEIISKMPLNITDGGLEKIGNKEFCGNVCEFRLTCKPITSWSSV
jgi:CRISPR/Cas system-associated exonuclease Cas4 (RecB family)